MKKWFRKYIGFPAMMFLLLVLTVVRGLAIEPWSDEFTPGVTYSSLRYIGGTVGFVDLQSKILIQQQIESAGLPIAFFLNGISYASPYMDYWYYPMHYLGATDGLLYSFSTLGTYPEWTLPLGGPVNGGAATTEISGNYYAFVTSTDGKIYAVNIVTQIKAWEFDMKSASWSTPVVSFNSGVGGKMIYAGAYNGKIYAINASTGVKLWEYQTTAAIRSSGVVNNGALYFANNDGKVTALDANSSSSTPVTLWEYQVPTSGERAVLSAPMVDESTGVIYFGCTDNKVYALNSDGTLKWSYNTGAAIKSSPIRNSNNIIIGSSNGNVYALNKTSGTGSAVGSAGSAVELDTASHGKWVMAKSVDGVLHNFGEVLPAPMPEVTGINPASKNYGSELTVDISGIEFYGGTSSSNVSSVKLDDTAETTLNISNAAIYDNEISGAVVPATVAVGTYNIKVTTDGGTNTTSSVKLVVLNPFPGISSVSPNPGNIVNATTIGISGSNFFGGTESSNVQSITLDTNPVTNINFSSATITDGSISGAVVPVGILAGSYNIKVTTQIGDSGTIPFSVTTSAPIVSGVTPSSGFNYQNKTIDISGIGFFGGTASSDVIKVALDVDPEVVLNKDNAVITNTSIAGLVVPANQSAGEYGIKVTTTAGTSAASVQKYTSVSLSAPSVSGIAPSTGMNVNAVTVTVSGTGFFGGGSAVVSAIHLEDTCSHVITVSSYNAVNDSVIDNVIIPAGGAVGTYDVKVTTMAGTNSTSGEKFVVLTIPH